MVQSFFRIVSTPHGRTLSRPFTFTFTSRATFIFLTTPQPLAHVLTPPTICFFSRSFPSPPILCSPRLLAYCLPPLLCSPRASPARLTCSPFICSPRLLPPSAARLLASPRLLVCSPHLLISSARLVCSPRLLASSALLVCSARLLGSSARLVCSARLLGSTARRICSPHLLASSARRISICSARLCSRAPLLRCSLSTRLLALTCSAARLLASPALGCLRARLALRGGVFCFGVCGFVLGPSAAARFISVIIFFPYFFGVSSSAIVRNHLRSSGRNDS